MSTRDIEKYLQQLEEKGHKKGREEGREEGFAQAVLAAYKVRFGAPPASLVAAIEGAKDQAALQRWLEVVTTRAEEEVAAMARGARATPAVRRAPSGKRASTTSRRSASPRRAAAQR